MHKNKLKSFITHPLISFLILLPYVKPAPELTGSFDIVFDLIKLVFFPVIIWGYIKYASKKPRLSLAIAMLQIVFLISTLISHGDIKSALIQSLSVIGCCMYTETLIGVNYSLSLKRIMVPLVLFATITSISMFITYPNGLYAVRYGSYVETSNYYWGFDNSSVFKFLPTMLCLGTYAINSKKRKTKYVAFSLMVFFTLSFFYVESITASVFCAILTIIYSLLSLSSKSIPRIKYKQVIIIAVSVFILLAFFNDKLELLNQFASEHDKYYSLKYRFIFWDRIFNLITAKPLWGYGIEQKAVTISRLGMDHPHNYFMDVIYRAGAFGVIAITNLFALFYRKKVNKKENIELYGIYYFLVIILVAQMDYYNEQFLFYPSLVVCFYLNSGRKKNEPTHD